jgi:hypothetical protein
MPTDSMISQSGAAAMSTLRFAGRFSGLFFLVLGLGLTSCDTLDDLMSVEAPSVVAAQDLDNPVNADLLVGSAVNDFRCALVHFIGAGAYVGMEWGVGADLGGGSWVWYDNRAFEPSGWTSMYAGGDCSQDVPNVYEPLSTARFMADDALRRLDRAISAAAQVGDSDIQNLARVGLARPFMDLGLPGEASTVASQVPQKLGGAKAAVLTRQIADQSFSANPCGEGAGVR